MILSLAVYLTVYLTGAYLLNDSNSKKNIYIAAGLALPIILAAGRYKVGTDFWQYTLNFKRWSRMPLDEFAQAYLDQEQLFRVISKLSYSIGGRFLTFGIIATLVLIPVFVSLREEYKDISHGTAIAVFLLSAYTSAFNICKEYIAVSIVFFGFKYIFDNKPIKYIICVIIAAMFHTTAYIALLLWFFWDHKKNMSIDGYKRIIYIIAAVIAVYYYRELITFFSRSISVFEDFANYSNDKEANNRDLYVSILKLILIGVMFPFVNRKNNKATFYLMLMILTVLIGFTGFSHPQVKRIAYYFSVPAEIFFAGYTPKCFKAKGETLLSFAVVAFYAALFILVFYILGQAHIMPYHFDLFSEV